MASTTSDTVVPPGTATAASRHIGVPVSMTRRKALLGLGGQSIREIMVRRLRDAGTSRITMCVSHLQEMIRDEFGDGSRFGVRIDYSVDPDPLGTAGPLLLVRDWRAPALVVN